MVISSETEREFRYARLLCFSEDEYVELHSFLPRKFQPKFWKLSLLITIGLACLFSSYTLLIGVALFVLLLLAWWAMWRIPKWIPDAARNAYWEHELHRAAKTFAIDSDGISIESRLLNARVPWAGIGMWEERGDWLVISATGIPNCFYQISDLKKSGIYDQVIRLCRKHGTEFGASA